MNEQSSGVNQTYAKLTRGALQLHDLQGEARYGPVDSYRGTNSSMIATAGSGTRDDSTSPKPPSQDGATKHPNDSVGHSNCITHQEEEPGLHTKGQRVITERATPSGNVIQFPLQEGPEHGQSST